MDRPDDPDVSEEYIGVLTPSIPCKMSNRSFQQAVFSSPVPSMHTVNAYAPRDFCFGSKFYGNELLTGSFFIFISGVLFITESRELSATHYSSYDLSGLVQNMYTVFAILYKSEMIYRFSKYVLTL